MPRIIVEGEIPSNLDPYTTYQVYNCLDSAITAQLLPVMKAKLNLNTARTYHREMQAQALCLEMSSKGLPTDQMALAELLFRLDKDAARAKHVFDRLITEGLGLPPMNPNSPDQIGKLFYDIMGFPEITEFDRKTGKRKRTTDIKALEKLRATYPVTVSIINAILAFREASKMASVFNRGLEPRTANLRGNISQSGTETGRYSSQQNPYGRGTNLQNLTDKVRQVITAPPGFAILNYDLKTAESLAVGYCSGSLKYIDACLKGDVHTGVAKLVWPELPWTGDLKKDKQVAESPFYRMFSYRDMSKRGGHGTNYYGTPRTMAMHLKVETRIIEEFQLKYFTEFPEIDEWHKEVIRRIMQDGVLVTRLGRERRFWGRPDDAATWREGIAFEPQSLIADAWTEGLLATQAWLMKECKDAKGFRGSSDGLSLLRGDLRAQVHDSAVFLVPLDAVDELAPAISSRLLHPVSFGNLGDMVIPNEAMIGKRWCKKPKAAPKRAIGFEMDGLRDYEPGMNLDWLR